VAPSDIGQTFRVIVTAANNDGSSTATSDPTTAVLSLPSGGGGNSPSSDGGLGASSPNTSGASVAATLGAPNGSPASSASVVLLNVNQTLARPYDNRSLKISGRVDTGQGAPIAGASLDVLEEIAGTSSMRLIGHTKSSPAGTFTASIPAGPSRRLEVAYRAYSTEPFYSAIATVNESVAAGAQLRITPKRTTSDGTITLSGKVSGPVPRLGAILDVLVRYHGEWVPVPSHNTGSHGNFMIKYRFHGGIGEFPFRVEMPGGQASFPYTEGYSNTVDVKTS
jgi:hypothetical protein